MPKPQVSVVKRQREQAKRERQQQKAEKRAQRKLGKEGEESGPPIIADEPVLSPDEK